MPLAVPAPGRRGPLTTGAVLIVALTCWLTGQGRASAAERPNILLVVSEDNGPELGCYGEPSVRTPVLDRLAAEGVRFDRAFVTQAGCSASRASFLTGLYPHQHGQVGLATWGFRLYRDDIPTLPRRLAAAGYRTGLIGKLHVNPEEAFPFGFKRMSISNFNRTDLTAYARHAAEFFTAGDAPFFLSINYPEAHDPRLRQVDGLPAAPLGADDVRALAGFGLDTAELRGHVADYYNCLMRLDALVGDLLSALEASGKVRDTLVIYMGDHGADMLRGKRTCYEGGLRIPLIARWPGRIPPRQVRRELVSAIDLLPTFLEVAGQPADGTLPGRSLTALFAPGAPAWREHLFAEYHTQATTRNVYPQRSVRDARWKLIENLLPDEVNPGHDYTLEQFPSAIEALATAPAAVQAGYRTMRCPPRYELYDLAADPHEFTNLAADPAHAAARDRLAAALAAWRRESADPLLDPALVRRFQDEVRGQPKKKEAAKHRWGYPDYFFGREPPAATPVPVRGKAA
jgi:N-sulfoglucosamine sulfohydrolase